MVVNFAPITALWEGGIGLHTFFQLPDFTFVTAFKGVKEIDGAYLGTLAAAYIPVAMVVFAEHIADHRTFLQLLKRIFLMTPALPTRF